LEYDRLTQSYYESQVQRIGLTLDRLQTIKPVTAAGQVVPDTGDIAIGTGRRLNMAVMFLDICHFSGRPAETSIEQDMILRVLNLFFTEMIRIAEDYGGTIEKNTGDGLMAYFEDGGGTPPANGCKRAVACALTMMYSSERIIAPMVWTTTPFRDLRFRIGIDYGPVTVAKLGARQRFQTLVAIGTSANLASRMLSVAGPGEIIIGRSVVECLPADWTKYCWIRQEYTGWVYRSTGLPYPFYRYVGCWTPPK